MNKMETCPNCKAELKSGLVSSNKLLDEKKVAIINEYYDNKSESYCNNCGKKLYRKFKDKMLQEKRNLTNRMQQLISVIPVISTHSPINWNYKILGMATGQSTTGTGVLTEFTASFTDLFGAQSERHNQKIRAGEKMCFAQIQKRALDLGGNAVIATDIDYSEIGAGKGMIMICMAGTVINLKNLDILGEKEAGLIMELSKNNQRLKYLQKFGL